MNATKIILALLLPALLAGCQDSMDTYIAHAVKELNQKAPFMIDKNIRFEQATQEGKKITYQYTMMQLNDAGIDLETIKTRFVPAQVKSVCQTYQPQGYFEKGYHFLYSYQDENEQPVIDLLIDGKTCREILTPAAG